MIKSSRRKRTTRKKEELLYIILAKLERDFQDLRNKAKQQESNLEFTTYMITLLILNMVIEKAIDEYNAGDKLRAASNIGDLFRGIVSKVGSEKVISWIFDVINQRAVFQDLPLSLRLPMLSETKHLSHLESRALSVIRVLNAIDTDENMPETEKQYLRKRIGVVKNDDSTATC